MNEIFVSNKSKMLGLSVEGTRRVLDSAFRESSRLVPELATAVAQKSYADVQSISHRIKGIFANLQFTETSAVAQEINLAAIDQKDWMDIQGLLTKLSLAYESLKKESGL